MGYSQTIPYSLIEIPTAITSSINVTSGWTTFSLATLNLPTYKNTPDYAYLDLTFQRFTNNFAGSNFLTSGSYIGIISGGSNRNGGQLTNDSMNIAAAGTQYRMFTIPGYTNLASYITSGGSYTTILYAKSDSNSIDLYDIYGKFRMYFAIN